VETTEEGHEMRTTKTATLLVATFAAIAMMAGTAVAQETDPAAESHQVSSVNGHRASIGSPQMSVHSGLLDIARRHSARMATDGTIYHNANLFNEISAVVPNWRNAGENVGTGVSSQQVHDLFLRSPKHRENIENPQWNIFAVGAVKDSDGMYYFTQIFVTTAAQSAPAPAAAPAAPAPAPVTKPAPKPVVVKPATPKAPAASPVVAPEPEVAPEPDVEQVDLDQVVEAAEIESPGREPVSDDGAGPVQKAVAAIVGLINAAVSVLARSALR
jgi:uncharacterized protein YkwD